MASSLDHQNPDLYQFLEAAIEARQAPMERHQALRLYNGFLEGEPRIGVDLYGATLVLHNYADPPAKGEPLVEAAQAFYLQHIPRLQKQN